MEHVGIPLTATAAAASAAASLSRAPARAEAWDAPDLAPEFDAARRALDQLTAAGLELRFHVDDRNRVSVQVLRADGTIIREIPASRLFDAISGGGLLLDGKA